MSRTGIPVARSLVSSDSQSRSLSPYRRRPSLPRSIAGSRPMRSYQRRVCWDRPHFSAASPTVQVVTIRAYELERALTQVRSFQAAGCHSRDMTVFDDLSAEQERLADILDGLDEAQWASASGAAGWTIADVVLHLAQSEESVVATASGGALRTGLAAAGGGTVDERVDFLVRAERAAPDVVFARWQRARRGGLAAARGADPDRALAWVAAPVKPATLATTRLAEHWAHGLDITGPLSLDL